MSTVELAQFRKILLIKPSSLGDCLQALPVLNALRKALPVAKIVWLINREYADLLRKHPALDGLILFEREHFRSAQWDISFFREVFELSRKLRAERFDLVIDLQGLFRSALMSQGTGARVRLGLWDAREWARAFYTHRVELQPTDAHAVDRYMRCLEMLGIAWKKPDFWLPIDRVADAEVDRMLERAQLGSSQRFVLVVPGARWQSKRWRAERFAEVIDRIEDELSLPCVLAGAGGEVELCREVAGGCKSKPVNLAGRTSLVQLAALTSHCELVLGHDSGTIHLAVALGKPLACIIGPTDPNRTGPYGRSDSIVRAEVPCAPCRLSVCADNKCMSLISVESVFAKVRSLLGR